MASLTSQSAAVEPRWDRPGGLGIKERRSWASWQLATVTLVALLVGMAIGHSGSGSQTAAGSGARPIFRLPPPSTEVTTTEAPATTPTSDAGGSPAGGAAASAPSSAPGSAAPPVVLVPNTNGSSSRPLPSFGAGGDWKIGWAYRCVLAAGGSGRFQVFAVPEGATPTAAAVDESGRESSGLTPQSGGGRMHLEVRSDPGCVWAVKVTGVPG